MIVILLLIHGLLAVALLGAITHQAFSVAARPAGLPMTSFMDRFSRVNAAAYVQPIILLFIATSIMGGLLYPDYRIDVRPTLEDLQLRSANGIFEIKEHMAAIGLGLLPVYWLYWRTPLEPEYLTTRRYLTWILAFLVWWNFLAGHVLNNIKGLWT